MTNNKKLTEAREQLAIWNKRLADARLDQKSGKANAPMVKYTLRMRNDYIELCAYLTRKASS